MAAVEGEARLAEDAGAGEDAVVAAAVVAAVVVVEELEGA
jgi:hypothetical protein